MLGSWRNNYSFGSNMTFTGGGTPMWPWNKSLVALRRADACLSECTLVRACVWGRGGGGGDLCGLTEVEAEGVGEEGGQPCQHRVVEPTLPAYMGVPPLLRANLSQIWVNI